MLATLIGNHLTREPTASHVLTKSWHLELMLTTNFGSLCPEVTNFGSQNFGYQIWFCTGLLICDNNRQFICHLLRQNINWISWIQSKLYVLPLVIKIVINFSSPICRNYSDICLSGLHSLLPSDTIWQHRYGSTLTQVMACCLRAPSHYLNQWIFTYRKVNSAIHLRAKCTSPIIAWN